MGVALFWSAGQIDWWPGWASIAVMLAWITATAIVILRHAVVTGGPYHYVCHPAYVGAVLYELAVPVLLASGWAAVVSGLTAILLVVRTALEDRTLQAELTGYANYARQVRYRLLPGIW